MARKSKAAILGDIHSQAMRRFTVILNREREDREQAVDDLKFANDYDGQWDEDSIERRGDRPRYTINRVAPAIDQVVGDQKQNKVGVKVSPASGDADKGVAEIYEGIIRNIENQSQAENAYDNAFEEQVTCGYGGWRVTTEYANESSFNQDIRIRPILSAATSLYFGYSEHYDKRDADHAFYTTFISKEEYDKKYPDSPCVDFPLELYNNTDWFRQDEIRLAEYWVKTPVTKRIALLSDGRVIDKDEEAEVLDELLFNGLEIVKERSAKSYKVEMYVMNGAEILRGPMAWAGKYIPLVPLFGRISTIDGRQTIRGLVRFAKDACRIYNFACSANIEAVALAPKDPYWLTPAMVGPHKAQFENFNKKNSPFMLFEPDERVGNMTPQRTGAPSVQQGLISILQQAELDVYATTGLHPAAMGNGSSLLSEKAIMSQAEKGDRGVYVFTDNLRKSIEYTGDILVDLIPRIMDTEQLVNVLGVDGTRQVIKVNEQAFNEFNELIIDQQTKQPVIVNDLSRGVYDVEAVAGPAFSTKKKESLEQLIELAGASEEFASISGDLIAKSLDVIESEEIAKRMRKIYIKKGMAEPTEEEIAEMGLDQPQPPDPQMIAMVENLNSQTAENMAGIKKTFAEINQKAVDAAQAMIDSFKVQQEAGQPVTMEQQLALLNQMQLVIATQEQMHASIVASM